MKVTSIDAPKKSSEKILFSNLRDDREKQTPNFHLGQLVRTFVQLIIKKLSAKRIVQIGVIINAKTEVIHDTIPSYRIIYLPERYNQNLLLPRKLSLDEHNEVMEKLNLIQ